MFTLVIVAGLLRAVIKRVMIFFSYFYSSGVLVILGMGRWGGSVQSVGLVHEILNCFY